MRPAPPPASGRAGRRAGAHRKVGIQSRAIKAQADESGVSLPITTFSAGGGRGLLARPGIVFAFKENAWCVTEGSAAQRALATRPGVALGLRLLLEERGPPGRARAGRRGEEPSPRSGTLCHRELVACACPGLGLCGCGRPCLSLFVSPEKAYLGHTCCVGTILGFTLRLLRQETQRKFLCKRRVRRLSSCELQSWTGRGGKVSASLVSALWCELKAAPSQTGFCPLSVVVFSELIDLAWKHPHVRVK